VQKAEKPKAFIPWFYKDYEADTGHLSFEESECYRRLLEALWKRHAQPLPNDDVVLARLVRAEIQAWLRYRPMMEPFFTITAAGWANSRLTEVYLWAAAKMQAATEHGRKGAQARWNKDAMPEDMPEQSHPESESESNSEPKPKIKKPVCTEDLQTAQEIPDEEEFLRRTRDLVGAEEMAGQRFFFWRKLLRDHPRAYTDALVDAESRKKEAARGLPEAQIRKTWAHYLNYQFQQMKKAYAS